VYGRGHIVSLAHSTIICAIDNPSEKFCLWMNLASFAIDEQELVSAHELMSGAHSLRQRRDVANRLPHRHECVSVRYLIHVLSMRASALKQKQSV
jgi:hypothetical protein